ncbi:MAG TPA: hypothetical protein VNF28_03875, partial [Candidatus Binataceae bacterium]|nr:hypothetical protein [Candidatus Binataceae bacterium]
MLLAMLSAGFGRIKIQQDQLDGVRIGKRPWKFRARPLKQETANGRTGGTSFTNGGAADLAARLFGLPGQGA